MSAPSPSDIATATAFVDGPFLKGRSDNWVAEHREKLIRQGSVFAMIERQDAELRARRAA